MKLAFFVVVCLLATQSRLQAGGWTQFRGSNHDGAATDPIRFDWTANPPKVFWKVPMPNGLSSFSVDKGHLYTMGVRDLLGKSLEFCIALDANTGSELWASPVGDASYPDGGVGPDDGARSTPTIEGDFVYAFGAYLNLVCFNATTGARVWSHDLVSEYGATVIRWQNAASPLLVGDLILVNGNGPAGQRLMAFRKSDGTRVWKTGNDAMTQSSPIVATIGGVSQAIFFAQSGLVSVAPDTGRVLWRYPITYNGTSVAASPVVAGNTVYASRAYPTRAGAVVVQTSGTATNLTATKIWEKPNQLMNHWATPIFYNGYYYGVYGQGSLNFRAVDASNGDTKWTYTGFGYGSVTRVQDKLLVLGDDGTLALVDTNPNAYTELARIQPLEGKCWNNPAVSDGRIYIRSTTDAVALDVSLPQSSAPAPLHITIDDQSSPGELVLVVETEDGSALDQAGVSSIEVSYSDDLSGAANWQSLSVTPALVNGKLSFSTMTPDVDARYYRAQRTP